MISLSSSLASSHPATSSKRVSISDSATILALLRPTPRSWSWGLKRRMSRNQMPKKMSAGSTQLMRSRRKVDSGRALKSTLYLESSAESSGSTRRAMKRCSVSSPSLTTFILPWMEPWPMASSVTCPALSSFKKSE